MGSTRERRALIRELIGGFDIASQTELLKLLCERGIPTNQPTLSRDLRALGAAKSEGFYRLGERVTPLDKLASLLRDARAAGPHLLVIRCEPGAASAIARALEAESPSGVIGTVAGDDTVFVAVESTRHQKRLSQRILALVD